MTIIDRLHQNAIKQKAFRHIVRGYDNNLSEQRKRIADIYFLHHYAGWNYSILGRHFNLSRERVRQIITSRLVTSGLEFTICHPKRSCM